MSLRVQLERTVAQAREGHRVVVLARDVDRNVHGQVVRDRQAGLIAGLLGIAAVPLDADAPDHRADLIKWPLAGRVLNQSTEIGAVLVLGRTCAQTGLY